ncbi:MAG: hydrogenase maturation nickel metallochaperone HypA [Chlorobiaceae bacterium]|nr:hydrogenase maturation nickel metallochaperone HypA [Chlorobiaceae bacterium]
MHEMSIAISIVDAVADRVCQEGCTTVSSIELVVGRLSGVEVESLRFCFAAAAAETSAAGAELLIVEREAAGACEDCGAEFPIASYHACCPSCGRFRVRVTSGEELAVKSITIE